MTTVFVQNALRNLKDGVRITQITNTTGTGTLSLSTTPTGYRAFSTVCSNTDVIYYYLIDGNGNQFEYGLGTFASNTLARTIVLGNNSGTTTPITLSGTTPHTVINAPAPSVLTGATTIAQNIAMSYNLLSEAQIKDYREQVYTLTSGATTTLSSENGNYQYLAMTSSTTITGFAALTFVGGQSKITLDVDYNPTTTATLTLPSVSWMGGTAPSITWTSGKKYRFVFVGTEDGLGGSWTGNYIGAY